MTSSMITVAERTSSVVSSSKLFSLVLTIPTEGTELEEICSREELSILARTLDQYCATQNSDQPWRNLLAQENPRKTETATWNIYIGPILAFKLFTVLSGSTKLEGKIPRSVMSPEMSKKLVRLARGLTEGDGWPSVFEEALAARWNEPPTPSVQHSTNASSITSSVPQKVAASVIQNLTHLTSTFKSKSVGNIIQNIQLAASCLSVMTVGVIDPQTDKDFETKLEDCLTRAGGVFDGKLTNILMTLNLTLAQFQAPLFCCLAISPILLFRTCQLQASRFGRHYYLPFMMSLGDIKPSSLREIETTIWKNLFLVARCQLSAADMMDQVLNSIVKDEVLESFRFDKHRLHRHFKENFDPIDDHTSFFFPDSEAIIKQEVNRTSNDRNPNGSSGVATPSPLQGHHPRSIISAQPTLPLTMGTPRSNSTFGADIQSFPLLFTSSRADGTADGTSRADGTADGTSRADRTADGTSRADGTADGTIDPSLLNAFSTGRDGVTSTTRHQSPLDDADANSPRHTSTAPLQSKPQSPARSTPRSPSPTQPTGPQSPSPSTPRSPSPTQPIYRSPSPSTPRPPPPAGSPPSPLTPHSRSPSPTITRSQRPPTPPTPHSPVHSRATSHAQSSNTPHPQPRSCNCIIIPKLPLTTKRQAQTDLAPRKRLRTGHSAKTKISKPVLYNDESGEDDGEGTEDDGEGTEDDGEGTEDDGDDEMDVDGDSTIPRFVVPGDKQRFPSPSIHVYSADHTRYFKYLGRHYHPYIARDLHKLAEHVDLARLECGLPTGTPVEWTEGMVKPAIIPAPRSLPEDSPIYTMEYARYLQISAKDMQDLFRVYPVIVVSGRPTRLKCDLASLEEWGNVDELRVMHDNSRFNVKQSDTVFVRASYREFLQTPKNLNSLDNPLSGGVPAPVQLATDLCAAVSAYDNFPSHIPVRVMTWGLLAKADAVHPPHTDRPGTCTFVAVEEGLKKWDLAFPPTEDADEEVATPAAYGSTMTLQRNYTRGWKWHSILLYPGTILFMRPGTVHSVTTLQDSIAVGGHFFSAPTLKYSIYSVYHTFVGSNSITNVPMDSEQQMLLRILLFWHQELCGRSTQYLERIANCGQVSIAHIPNVRLFSDFVNLAILCNYGELVLVLTPWRYNTPSTVNFKQDFYKLPRQRSRELRRWLNKHFYLTLDPPVPDGFTDQTRLNGLLSQYLSGQAHTLWQSVKQREAIGVLGAKASQDGQENEITHTQVLNAIREDLSNFPGFSLDEEEPAPKSYAFPAPPSSSQYVVKMKKDTRTMQR